MRNIFLGGAAAAMVLGLGACATTPVEEEVAVIQEVAQPEPVEEVIEEPVEVVVAEPIGPLAGSVADFQTNAGERVYFDLNQWRLDGSDQDVLQRQAAWLQAYPDVRVLIAGNCDERGTREYNIALGERRASIVKEYLVDLGIDGARIETISNGKERPIDGGSNDVAWSKNRNGFTQIVSGARTG